MPHYLLEAAYSSHAWDTQVKNPQNRFETIRPMIERLGGRLESAYYTFGEYDVVAIVEMPSNVNAAAFSIAASAGGAVKAIKTTPLMTVEEGVAAMRKAPEAGYRPPTT